MVDNKKPPQRILKKRFSISFLVLIFLCAACATQERPIKAFDQFQLPVVINSQYADSAKKGVNEVAYLQIVFPPYVGKFTFSDTIDIAEERQDTAFYHDFIDRRSTFIENQHLSEVNGFEIAVDYETEVFYPDWRYYEDSTLYPFYPIYIINSTQTDKVFFGKEGHGFGIQEASTDINSSRGNWYPIEQRGVDFCGIGRWGMTVKPKEFLVFLMAKYEGDFETKLRVRMQNGESIFVSTPFEGKINKAQFYQKDGSTWAESQDLNFFFYGSTPKYNLD